MDRSSRGYFLTVVSILIIFWFWLLIGNGQERVLEPLRDVREPFVQTVIIEQLDTWDSREVKFVSLKGTRGSVLLSGDKDVELIQFLLRNNGKKVILSVE
jgi:hypothetical protein